MNRKIIPIIFIIIMCVIPNIVLANNSEYYKESYWEWHTRTTDTDAAYNGKHIQINNNKIDFFGYGDISYKDFLYKEYEFEGNKIFKFQLDESRANYHTLDGAGFILNAKKSNGKLTGDILVIQQNDITIFRLENVDIQEFETTNDRLLSDYQKDQFTSNILLTQQKPTAQDGIHRFVIKTSPTNITVIDNEEEVIDLDLDYKKHAGDDFGLIASYNSHNCSQLTQIEFSEFEIELKDYAIQILNTDKKDNPIQKSKFQISDSEGNILKEVTTDDNGQIYLRGITSGEYKLRQTAVNDEYILNKDEIEFTVTNDGEILDSNTNKEIELHVINEKKVITKVENDIKNNSNNKEDNKEELPAKLPDAGKTWFVGLIILALISIVVQYKGFRKIK